MTDTKFTAWHWRFGIDVVDDMNVWSGDDEVGGDIIVGGCGCCGSPYTSNAADAHLIAAAPDLYEALERLLGAVEYVHAVPGLRGEELHRVRRGASAALAKARGETA